MSVLDIHGHGFPLATEGLCSLSASLWALFYPQGSKCLKGSKAPPTHLAVVSLRMCGILQ